MIGQRVGKLTVIADVTKAGSGSKIWECLCDCGNRKSIYQYLLIRTYKQPIRSCGCMVSESATTHGMSRTSVYSVWLGMIGRCRNPNIPGYKNYGGRGITVCDRWKNSFENFLVDMGDRPKGMQIERIDNNKGYFKDNCRWATRKEQMRNRRNNIFAEYNGERKTVSEWAEIHNISPSLLFYRLKRWGDMQKALHAPAGRTSKYLWFVNGQRYETITEAVRGTGINETKLFRLSEGATDAKIDCYKVIRQSELL